MLEASLEPSWKEQLFEELNKDYFKNILRFIAEEKAAGKIIYPKEEDIFQAFALTPFDQVKVVILGQDPYHNPRQAHGLSFSVQSSIKIPPSLVNIFKELKTDLGIEAPLSGNLNNWAKQGVLLLNAALTVEANKPMSHSKIGWQVFTDAVIKKISTQKQNVVFILWGKFAQSKAKLMDKNKHLILEAAHPSPLSAYNGFYGCKHFSKTNEYLIQQSQQPIDWTLY